MRLEKIQLHRIIRPANPHRTSFDEEEMQELVDSIKQLGLIQPIVVEPIQGGYQVKAGDRRLEACRRAGLHDIDAIIRAPGDMLNGEAVTWAENLNRADLPPMDQARQVHRMRAVGNLDVDKIARIVNRSPTWVQQRLDLYQLPSDLTDAIEKKQLAAGAALALGRVTDAKHRQYLTAYTIASGANIGVVRDWVATWEAEVARGEQGDHTLPPLPIDGQTYVVSVPCWLCHEPDDHNHMLIKRVCRPCEIKMQTAINEADAEAKSQPPERTA